MFYRRCFFSSLFLQGISKLCRPIAVKVCTVVSTRPNFITLVQNLGGTLCKKIFRAKNLQNLAQFRPTSKFGGKYLSNR